MAEVRMVGRDLVIVGSLHRVKQGRVLLRSQAEKESKPLPKMLRVARMLAVAHTMRARLDVGEFMDLADMAKQSGLSRARVTQLLNLTLLAPDIQEEILWMESPAGDDLITEHELRLISAQGLWETQRRLWRALKARSGRAN